MRLRSEARRDRGATAVEYGLMVALVVGVIISLLATVGTRVLDLFRAVPPF